MNQDAKFKKATQKEVAEHFKVSRQFVSFALKFERNSKLAQEIRSFYASLISKKADEILVQNERLAA